MLNRALYLTLMSGGSALVVSEALSLLDGEDGLALDFTDTFFDSTGFYGSAAVVGGGTLSGYNGTPDYTAASILTYTSPSLKMTMGPSGTLRFGAHNLAAHSESMSTSPWDGEASAPTATTILNASGSSQHRRYMERTGLVANAPYTFSVELSAGANAQYCRVALNFSNDTGVTVDLLGGTITNTYADVGTLDDSSIESLGGGVYRVSVTATINSATQYIVVAPVDVSNAGSNHTYTGSADVVVNVSKAHLRRSPSDSTYLTTGASSRISLPYQWSSAGVLEGILVEESRTNLFQGSMSFSNGTYWTPDSLTVGSAVTSPDGRSNAYNIYPTSTGSGRRFTPAFILTTTAATHATSFIVKYNGIPYVYSFKHDGSAVAAWFNIQTGTVGTVGSGYTASITDLGNGWYRCASFGTGVAGSSFAGYVGISSSDNSESVTASGTNGVYFYHGQCEAGAFLTSPIETFAASVTRAADNISLSTGAFPESYATGTTFAEFQEFSPAFGRYIVAQSNASLQLYDAGGTYDSYDGTSSVAAAAVSPSTAINKAAVSYTVSTRLGAVNGTAGSSQAYDGSFASDPSWYFGCNGSTSTLNGYLRKIVVLPRAMTLAELQTLTT